MKKAYLFPRGELFSFIRELCIFICTFRQEYISELDLYPRLNEGVIHAVFRCVGPTVRHDFPVWLVLMNGTHAVCFLISEQTA